MRGLLVQPFGCMIKIWGGDEKSRRDCIIHGMKMIDMGHELI